MNASCADQLSMNITDWRSRVHNTTHHTIPNCNPSCGPVNARLPFYSILLQILIIAMTDNLNIGFRVFMGGALVAPADIVICDKIEKFTGVILYGRYLNRGRNKCNHVFGFAALELLCSFLISIKN
jgi:hypothetical protein